MFKGYYTALITPFADGKVDEKAYKDFVNWQIEEGINGLVPCGTTGESPTLSHGEHSRVIELCVETSNGRVPVIAGSGSNCTSEAVSLTKEAKQAGVDACLIVCPYYNKPSQEGIYRHYMEVADVGLPVVVYNVPGRSGVGVSVETLKRLSAHPNIVATKDATGDLERPLLTRCELGADFCQLSGEDSTIAAFLAQGGHGCISVTANIAPRLCSDLYKAWEAKDTAKFEEIRDLLLPLHKAMFVESNPCPVKYAASLLEKTDGFLRSPLCEISESSKQIVETAMKKARLI